MNYGHRDMQEFVGVSNKPSEAAEPAKSPGSDWSPPALGDWTPEGLGDPKPAKSPKGLKSEITILQGLVAAQDLKIDALTSRLNTAEPEIDALEEADGKQDTKISDLEGTQGTLASDVGTLKTDLDEAELLITGNADDISDLEPSLPVESYYEVLAADRVLVRY